MTGWCLLHPAGVDPTRWVAAAATVPVTTVTVHPRAALLLVASGQVDGVVLSHDWWQLDGLVVPARELAGQADDDVPSGDRPRRLYPGQPRRPVIRDPGDLPPERRPRWRR